MYANLRAGVDLLTDLFPVNTLN